MTLPLKHWFTTYGDVYPGDEFYLPGLSNNYQIIIQRNKSQTFQKLDFREKTIENIDKNYGWVLSTKTIVKNVEVDKEFFDSTIPKHGEDYWKSNWNHKVMFIIGAGASANCIYGSDAEKFRSDNFRPPFGPNLFDRRFSLIYGEYKGVVQSLGYLQEQEDLEKLMEDDWTDIRAGNTTLMKRHINIQYYIQELLRRVSASTVRYPKNLFSRLTDKLQRINARDENRKFAFVSFNQDTILEKFLSDNFNKHISTIDDFVDVHNNPFCLFKPHGSWNWGWKFLDFDRGIYRTPEWLFNNDSNYYEIYFNKLGHLEEMVDWSGWGSDIELNASGLGKISINKSKISIIPSGHSNDYFPSLLLPYDEKDEFMMPQKHSYVLKRYLDDVETLVIIGWKGNEAAFNRVLLNRGHRIKKVIIADPDHKAVEKNLEAFLTSKKIIPITFKGFEEFVMEGLDEAVN